MCPTIINHGPIPKLESYLEEAKQTNYWFYAVVFSAIEVEKYGCDKIRSHLAFLKVEPSLSEVILEKISLFSIAKSLSELEVIDKNEYDTILRLNQLRNSFVHRTANDPKMSGTEATKEYEPLVKEAITILKEKLDAERIFVYH